MTRKGKKEEPKEEKKEVAIAASAAPAKSGKASKWRNRERVLVFCSRGVSYRDRHLMQDFRNMLAHSKSESKMDKNESIGVINEICDMRNATKALYFECKKKKDLYLWVAAPPKGPSVKFFVHNIHTMGEMRLAGNCLTGSRPLLSFDKDFDRLPHLSLLKELFIQTFGTPAGHPKSQPFLDHVFHFGLSEDGRIWFRNYQIVEESGQLEEIGPRMVLEIIKIFDGSFGGEFLFENPDFVNPNTLRREAKAGDAEKYMSRVESRKFLETRRAAEPVTHKTDPLDGLFETGPRKRPLDDDDSDDDEKPTLTDEAARLQKRIQAPRRKKPKKKAAKKVPAA